jgi:c-di-GMP-binding flagellar brake protein YcgR
MKDGAMEIFEILKTGAVVEIGILIKDRVIGSYPGYIRRLTEHGQVDIGVPALIDQEFPLIKGHFVKIKLVTPDGLYSFQGQVLEREEGSFAVEYPAQLKRLERREYGRFAVGIPVVFQIKGKSVCTGHTADLSGGGTLLLSKNEMKVGDQPELQFVLPEGIAGNAICGEVKRRMVIYLPEGEEGRNYIYGISFVQICDSDRKAILSYLSEIKFTIS